ncbi:Heavy-metal resistance protein CzcE [Noviherbaspirillum humi]|uniref:Heavy-metal resistance protein CzcE n=1 Tax=Noviherbaspirillum humi TaxID=1688639 RepID=A0A239I7J9_9BURK|nr:CzcE family metal-binding protein [Noviherbaspirillum humi]SNS89527.1 Heavy-metal resistance protein CzcE [Noviherbaspirillum humi]
MNVLRMLRISLFALMLAGLASACSPLPVTPDFYGAPAAAYPTQRTVVITPATRYVNVEGGETINFAIGDKSFAWQFFATAPRRFDLNFIAPPGLLDHRVEAFVSPDPRYIGDSGDKN